MIVLAGAGVGRAVEAEAGVGGQRRGGEGAGGLAHEEGPAQHRVEATMVRPHAFWLSHLIFPPGSQLIFPLYLLHPILRRRIPPVPVASGADYAISICRFILEDSPINLHSVHLERSFE